MKHSHGSKSRVLDQHERAPLVGIVCALALTVAAVGQQPNTATASAVWAGVSGPPWPVRLSLTGNVPLLTYQVTGAPSQPYALVRAPAGLSVGSLPTPFGSVDLDLSGGYDIPLDGIGGLSWMDLLAVTNASGVSTWTMPVPPGLAGPLGTFQTVVQDPTAPAGFRLTAATELTFDPLDIYVSAAAGAPGNPGTLNAPMSTLAAAFALMQLQLPTAQVHIHVAAGTYAETFNVANTPFPVTISGGCDAAWVHQPGVRSVINVGATGARFNNMNGLTVTGVEFNQPSNPNPSGHAIPLSVLSMNASFTDCGFVAGNGSVGVAGAAGPNGAPGGNGVPGWNGGTALGLGGYGGVIAGCYCYGGAGGNGLSAFGEAGHNGAQLQGWAAAPEGLAAPRQRLAVV